MAPAHSQQLYARAAPRRQAWLRDFLVQLAIPATCITTAVLLGTEMAVRALVIICGAILVKSCVGLWVFIAVYVTRRSQGIHDLGAGTVVVPRDAAATVPRRGFAIERA